MEIKLPDISDALKPLPKLRSLVITEIENFAHNTPIDRNIFGIVFLVVFGLLISTAFLLPDLGPRKSVQPAPVVQQDAPPPLTPPQQAAIEKNDGHWHDPLPQAPIKEMLDPSSGIPIIAADGRQAWVSYARPYDRNDIRPRIVFVVTDLGLSQQISQSSIADLPGPISLVFSHLSNEPDSWMDHARQTGHEVLLSIPMEPLDYPASDPGPNTLLVHNTDEENKALLLKHLVYGKGYVGLTSLSGSRISSTPEKLKPILQELKQRGLMWMDANLTPLSSGDMVSKELKLPFVKADLHIDENMGPDDIRAKLKEAEAAATKDGRIVVVVQATPLVISLLRDWTAHLPERHISLAPLSSLAE